MEEKVIDALYNNLFSPDAINDAADMIYKESQKSSGDIPVVLEKYKKELTKIQRGISGIVNAIADGMYDPSLKEKMQELRESQTQYRIRVAEISAQLSINALTRQQVFDYLFMYQNIKNMPKQDQKKAISLFVNNVTVYEEDINMDILILFKNKNDTSTNTDVAIARPERSNLNGGDEGN